jgi:Icc-related predicted phosphoesterase
VASSGNNEVMAPVRIAAAGDIHCTVESRERVAAAFAALDPREVDAILLAGDLTGQGDPAEAKLLAEICRDVPIPIFAVLGNHDWHANQTHEVVALLSDAGIRMLERSTASIELRGTSVGIVGLKGFVGGFPDHTLPDFGEPLLREVYAETTCDVEALERGLGEVEGADVRVVLLHYSPTQTTLEGEPRGIWAFLGSDRLGGPIVAHRPDLVVHGHAHAGNFEGFVGPVPVYNVAVHVTGKDFWIFELAGEAEEPAVDTRVAEKPAV